MHPRDYFIAQETTLYNLFVDGDYKFKIPDNQRHFSWSDLQLQQLWKDLKETVSRSYTAGYDLLRDDQIEPHFFGAIYLTEESLRSGLQDISDGQQRLICCTILLKLLSEYSSKLSAEAHAGIMGLIIPCLQKSKYGEPYQPRLELDDTVDSFFRNYILLKNSMIERNTYLETQSIPSYMDSISNIIACNAFFNKCLELELPDFLLAENPLLYEKKLLAFIKTLQDFFVLLRIQVKKEATMYVIFETLNDRGLDLSESDLIKNLFFKQPNIAKQAIKEKWDNITENIENEDLTSYIRFHYNSKNTDIVDPKNLFNKVKGYLERPDVDPIVYLQDLLDESVWYGHLTLKGTSFWNNETNEKLNDLLNRISVSHSLPLLLAGAVQFGNSQHEFLRLVNAILAFCFRFFTIGTAKVEELERKMNTWANALRTGDSVDQCIDKMKDVSKDDVFKLDFENFSTKSNDLAFYVFYQLEKYKGSNAGLIPHPHSTSQHVEHIMPKKPGNYWPHVSNDPLYNKFVYRLGNLLILERDINQRVKNKEYSFKISNSNNQDYNHSHLYYPRQVAGSYSSWDLKNIQDRQMEIAKEAVIVWAID